MSVILVTHDLGVVAQTCDRVTVMYAGRLVESAPVDALFVRPRHPYTRALLDAAPDIDPTRRTPVAAMRGELPSPVAVPPGCPFHTRCAHSFDRCRAERPLLTPRTPEHRAACQLTGFGAEG